MPRTRDLVEEGFYSIEMLRTEGMLLTKVEAKARGSKHYFTGKPCLRGHVGARRTSNGQCVKCQQTHSRSYWDNNYEKCRASRQRHYAANRDKLLTESKAYNTRVRDLIAVLREEMPELLGEFGL